MENNFNIGKWLKINFNFSLEGYPAALVGVAAVGGFVYIVHQAMNKKYSIGYGKFFIKPSAEIESQHCLD